jgi:hypothetical protein
MRSGTVGVAVLLAAMAAVPLRGAPALEFHGFALLRGATAAALPLDDYAVSAQVQAGVDWRPSPAFGAHVHLLARNDQDGSHRGHAGVVQAYLEQTVERGEHRLRLTEGAFFLPTSRENVDALWESPYAISSSALNSWLGEEFRPVGVDASYMLRRAWTVGATVFTGNDTFGALPAERGWKLHDHWTLLGEHVPVDAEYFTSVSAENDRQLGYSARARWTGRQALVQLTHIDNASDALPYGDLLNWDTRFDIAGGEYTFHDWTVAAEYGWGRTIVIPEGEGTEGFTTDIAAGYILVSRLLENGRVTLRVEHFQGGPVTGDAVTAAYFWTPLAKLRAGIEASVAGDEGRVAVEARYSF